MSFITDELLRLVKEGGKDANADVIIGVIQANLLKEVIEISSEAHNEVMSIGKSAVEKYKKEKQVN